MSTVDRRGRELHSLPLAVGAEATRYHLECFFPRAAPAKYRGSCRERCLVRHLFDKIDEGVVCREQCFLQKHFESLLPSSQKIILVPHNLLELLARRALFH